MWVFNNVIENDKGRTNDFDNREIITYVADKISDTIIEENENIYDDVKVISYEDSDIDRDTDSQYDDSSLEQYSINLIIDEGSISDGDCYESPLKAFEREREECMIDSRLKHELGSNILERNVIVCVFENITSFNLEDTENTNCSAPYTDEINSSAYDANDDFTETQSNADIEGKINSIEEE